MYAYIFNNILQQLDVYFWTTLPSLFLFFDICTEFFTNILHFEAPNPTPPPRMVFSLSLCKYATTWENP